MQRSFITARCSRGQIVPTPSHTRGVTGQTVNYFWPLVKGAKKIAVLLIYEGHPQLVLKGLGELVAQRFLALDNIV